MMATMRAFGSIDAMSYWSETDGVLEQFSHLGASTSEFVQEQLPEGNRGGGIHSHGVPRSRGARPPGRPASRDRGPRANGGAHPDPLLMGHVVGTRHELLSSLRERTDFARQLTGTRPCCSTRQTSSQTASISPWL